MDACSSVSAGAQSQKVTYAKVFRAAREATFTPDVLRGSLVGRPYDLRHATVSTWLAGVPAATVAEWAGQAIAVLLEVYASFLGKGQQVETALGSGR
ncbi:hypothetical protein AB0J55_30270 [Amycolatopsis sp. NPDC049688]|uniref:hypothetical protein n=1 Tax=Amycolatopsis sp. NPDC049688 TaxID=3154733 RepID=UPI003427F450